MSSVCNLLSGHDIGDVSTRAKLLDQYASAVIASENLSLAENVEFVEFLMLDPLTIDDGSWKHLREQKARLWLAARKRVEGSVDPKFDFNDRPFINVPTPPGSGVPSSSSPDAIKSPELREAYRAAIAKSTAKAQYFNDQYWLQRMHHIFIRTLSDIW